MKVEDMNGWDAWRDQSLHLVFIIWLALSTELRQQICSTLAQLCLTIVFGILLLVELILRGLGLMLKAARPLSATRESVRAIWLVIIACLARSLQELFHVKVDMPEQVQELLRIA